LSRLLVALTAAKVIVLWYKGSHNIIHAFVAYNYCDVILLQVDVEMTSVYNPLCTLFLLASVIPFGKSTTV